MALGVLGGSPREPRGTAAAAWCRTGMRRAASVVVTITIAAVTIGGSAQAESHMASRARASGAREPDPPPSPTLRLGELARRGVRIDRVGLTARSSATTTSVTLTIALSTRWQTAREAVLPIELPAGAAAVGVALVRGDARVIGAPTPAERARPCYEAIVEQGFDPALVDQDLRGDLVVHVFPVDPDESVVVELDLELPAGPTIALDPGSRTIAVVDTRVGNHVEHHTRVRAPIASRLDVGARDTATRARASHAPRVDRHTSLFATEPVESRRRFGYPVRTRFDLAPGCPL